MSFASCALNCRPVSMISRAYGAPTVSTRFFIDEARYPRPILAAGMPKRASSPAILRSQTLAMLTPAPRQ